MTRIRFALVLLPLSAIAGCDDDASIPLADLGAKFAAAECDVGVRCGTFADKASCMASLTVDLGQYAADVKAGRMRYDGNAAANCMAAFESAQGSGGCSVTSSLSTPQSMACQSIFTGTVTVGGSCFDSSECQSGSCDTSACTGTAACCAGSCVVSVTPLAADIGMACSTLVSTSCVDGAFCQATTSGNGSGICTARLDVGKDCTVFIGQCAAGTVCVPGASVCGKLPAEGAACGGAELCDVENDYCDATTGLCAPRVAPGGACPTGAECVAYAHCDAASLTCVANGGAGAACDSTSQCLGTLQCSSATGLCTAPAPQGTCL
jgi:hypothetical protein